MLDPVYLCLSCFSFISWDANLIEDRMQLTDYGGHLCGKVAGVHHGCLDREVDAPGFGNAGRLCMLSGGPAKGLNPSIGLLLE